MWQAQYLVTFWEIAGPRNVVFFNTKLSRSSHGEGLRSGGCEMTILSSDYPRLSSDYPRLSSNRLYIGGSTWGTFTWDLPLQDYVAGAVFGEGGVWLYVAGAVLGDILGESRTAKCCIFQYKTVAEFARGRSPKRRVRDDDFILGLSSIILGLSSIILESSLYWRKHLRHFYLRSSTSRLCGRRSIWWRWSVTFRGRRSIWWRGSVTFRGRRSTLWQSGR